MKYTILGDSISIQYTPFLQKIMGESFSFIPKTEGREAYEDLDIPQGANCGDSRMLLAYLKASTKARHLDSNFYLVNAGLHDIKTDPQTGIRQVGNDEYRKNLLEIFELLTSHHKKVIFVNTTNADETVHNTRQASFYRYAGDVKEINEIAEAVCKKQNIPMIDLYRFTLQFGTEAFYDHVHYYPEISEKQAEHLKDQIYKIRELD